MLLPNLIPDINFSEKLNQINLKPERLALGTAALGGVWGKVNSTESVETILYALENGVKVIDTAPAYFKAEKYLGEALKQWKGELPLISTKVGRLKSEKAEDGVYDYSFNAMRNSILESLEILNIDHLPLVFLHDPDGIPIDEREEIISSLEKIKEELPILHFGLGGNFDEDWFKYLKTGFFKIVMGFNRLDACCLDALQFEIPFYDQHQISFYAGSPLHMGLLGRRLDKYSFNPPEWVSAKELSIAIKIKSIAEKYDMELPSLAQRYLFSIKQADRIVLGSRNKNDLISALSDFEKGILPKEIFNEINLTIANT